MNERNELSDNTHNCRVGLQHSSGSPGASDLRFPFDCHNAHGEGRWSVKTDPSLPPTDASAIQPVTPSEMFSWPGPDAALTMQSERIGIENKWFALTGRVVELKVVEFLII